MTINLDVLNSRYTDEDGGVAFTDIGMFYYHHYSKKMYEKNAFDAFLTANGLAFAQGELGDGSTIQQEEAPFAPVAAPAPGQPAVQPQQPVPQATPITVNVSGGGTNGLALEVQDGPQAGAGTVTVAGLAVDGTPIPVTPINIADTDTAAQVATKIQAALDQLQDAGSTITITATVAVDGVTVNLTQAGSIGTGNFDNGATVTVA